MNRKIKSEKVFVAPTHTFGRRQCFFFICKRQDTNRIVDFSLLLLLFAQSTHLHTDTPGIVRTRTIIYFLLVQIEFRFA